jgi:glycosyltransferase involved in cell wall biosynthesis
MALLLADYQFPLAGRLRIVVDDASTDGTAAVAGAKVAGYPGARWEKTEKTGQAVSPV